jgi:poly-gamma-glutamate synthesis protein (capsule biosynthesis protein)
MAGKYEAPRGHRRRRRRRKNSALKILVIFALLLALALGGMLLLLDKLPNPAGPKETKPSDPIETTAAPTETTVPPTTEPEVIHVTSQATIAATGDLLMHLPVVNAHAQGDGTYNFDRAFQYLKAYSEAADYAIANLETTLAGTNNGYAYSGYPCFNCPDSIVDGAIEAGFDMLLTANNHTYDTRHVGMMRTLEIIADRGILSLGTTATAEEPKYVVVDINGINIGMVCYTYETPDDNPGRPSLNTIPVTMEDAACLNSFDYAQLDKFYTELEGYIDAMEAEGAEGLMLFIHWGEEYMLTPTEKQQAIAQKVCDLGFDVIVGGHPHVVQPMDLLTSTVDPDQKTVCIYSVGNALSNQSRNTISRTPQGHCEDGMLFSVTFSKYSDGTVVLEGTDVLPTWVNWMEAHNKYNILPLDMDTVGEWQTLYNIGDNAYATAKASYDRTMALVGEGLAECQAYLEEAKADREMYYYNLAWGIE